MTGVRNEEVRGRLAVTFTVTKLSETQKIERCRFSNIQTMAENKFRKQILRRISPGRIGRPALEWKSYMNEPILHRILQKFVTNRHL